MRPYRFSMMVVLAVLCSLALSMTLTAQERLTSTGTFAPQNNTRDLDVGLVITETESSTVVTKFGASDTFTATLTQAPSADVQVHFNLRFHAIVFVTVEPNIATFTPANWNVPQTFTLHAIHDYNESAQPTSSAFIRYALETVDNGVYASEEVQSPSFITVVNTSVAAPSGPLVVTTLADSISAEIPGSLRQMMLAANARAGEDVITFDPALTGSIVLDGNLPNLTAGLSIIGSGQSVLTLDGGGLYHGFQIYDGVANIADFAVSGLTLANMKSAITSFSNVSMTDVTVTNSGGASFVHGGLATVALFNEFEATLTRVTMTGNSGVFGGALGGNHLSVHDSTFINNEALSFTTTFGELSAGGGAIYTENYAEIFDSTFEGNTSDARGGAVYAQGMVLVMDSTFTGNSAEEGGAINTKPNPSVLSPGLIFNSTFSTNHAAYGGVINTENGVNVFNSTFSANSATEAAAAIYGPSEVTYSTFSGHHTSVSEGVALFDLAFLIGSVIANNNAVDPYECDVSVFGFGLLANDPNCFGSLGVPTGVDPVLRDNGGSTQTHALLAGSNAIDIDPLIDVDVTACDYLEDILLQVGSPVITTVTDQRGVERPQGALCDFGAFEYQEPVEVVNLLTNGSFETAGSVPVLAAGWVGKIFTVGDKRLCLSDDATLITSEGTCVFQFWESFRATKARSVGQSVAGGDLGAAGDTLTLSAMVEGLDFGAGAYIGLELAYVDGSTGKHGLTIPSGTYAFTEISQDIPLTGTVARIDIRINVGKGLGRIRLDDVRLVVSAGEALLPLPDTDSRPGAALTLPPAPDGFRQ